MRGGGETRETLTGLVDYTEGADDGYRQEKRVERWHSIGEGTAKKGRERGRWSLEEGKRSWTSWDGLRSSFLSFFFAFPIYIAFSLSRS